MKGMSEWFEGVRVLDLTRLLPGPFASLLLADMGAEVIKIEAPGRGDYARFYPPMVGESSAFFQSLNRNKRSMVLNLKADEGVALLGRLVEEADVLLESFRPGVLERLGMGPEAMWEHNEDLIIASVTGYGQVGSKRDEAGHDANYLALSGLLERNGRAGEGPHVPGFQVADLAGGALYCALGVTSALWQRERGGGGVHLDISMTEGALSLLAPAIARHAAGQRDERGEGMLSGGLPSYRVYATKDDRHLAVAALEPKFWEPLVQALEAPELSGRNMEGGEKGREVQQRLEEIFRSESLEIWMERLGPLDLCVEPVLNLDEVMEQELHRSREAFFELNGVAQVRTPLTERGREHRPAPGFGEHTEQVLEELLEMDEESIEALRKNQVIGS